MVSRTPPHFRSCELFVDTKFRRQRPQTRSENGADPQSRPRTKKARLDASLELQRQTMARGPNRNRNPSREPRPRSWGIAQRQKSEVGREKVQMGRLGTMCHPLRIRERATLKLARMGRAQTPGEEVGQLNSLKSTTGRRRMRQQAREHTSVHDKRPRRALMRMNPRKR